MEYIVGPVLALLIGLKFTHHQSGVATKKLDELDARIEFLENEIIQVRVDREKKDEELSRRVVETVMPVAKAVNKLNQTVGI